MKSESGIGKRRLAAKEDLAASYLARRDEIAEAAARVFNKLGLERASMYLWRALPARLHLHPRKI